MKTRLFTRFFATIACVAFLGISTGNALAIPISSRVISPYWQSDSATYSFIAVSHPSLSGMASQIGVVINAIQDDKAAFATAAEFTVSAGQTKRVFIVGTGHATINPTSLSIPAGQFVRGATTFQHGHVRVDPKATSPTASTSTGDGDGARDVTMLEFWGAVVVQANSTGFAMEFIGDAHDSVAGFNNDKDNHGGLN